jgi:peptidyl-tRNA hydrolase
MTSVLGEDERQELERLRKMELEMLRKRDEDTDDPPVMYLVVRTDLKMSGPKIAVQVGHGVQIFMQVYMMMSAVNQLGLKELPPEDGEERPFTEEEMETFRLTGVWLKTNYTKILLGADDHEFAKIKQDHDAHVPVVDLGRTEVAPNTETMIVLPPMRKSSRSSLLKRLRLLEL